MSNPVLDRLARAGAALRGLPLWMKEVDAMRKLPADQNKSDWVSILDSRPKMHQHVWAYDIIHDKVHMAVYRGKKNERGYARLEHLYLGGEDCFFVFWQPVKAPDCPDAEQVKAAYNSPLLDPYI